MPKSKSLKIYKPLFSIIVIIIQLILSFQDYYQLEEWKNSNPELDTLVDLVIHYDNLFLFVLIIGICEMLTEPSWLKTSIRLLLFLIVSGYQLSGMFPVEDLNFGIYYTAEIITIVCIVLIFVRIGGTFSHEMASSSNKTQR